MTRPRLQAILSAEEDRTLLELRTATSVPQRTKDRAEVLRLSHRGWTSEKIAEYFDWRVETVRETIYRWRDQGLGGLWDAPRPGRRPKWQEADIAHLEQSLQQDAQTHNSKQLVHQLQQERWLWHAIDHKTGQVLAYVLANHKDQAFIEMNYPAASNGVSESKKSQLFISVQSQILSALIFHILGNHPLIPMLADCTSKIPITPKLSTP